MILLVGIMFLVQTFLAWHCVKTGRSKVWVYLIMFLPTVGSVLYVITQLLPALRRPVPTSEEAPAAARRAIHVVKSVEQLRESKAKLLTSDVALPDMLHCREQLADECMQAELYADAEDLYLACLQGDQATNPTIQLKLAQALFEQSLFARARAQLEQLIADNPEFRSPQGHLLFARSLQALNDKSVVEEYQALLQNYPGEEARVRYALYLQTQGDMEQADQLFAQCISRCRRAPEHYRKSQAPWIMSADIRMPRMPSM